MIASYYLGTPAADNDNLQKPIQDALNGVVYADDRQVRDSRVLQYNMESRFFIRRAVPAILEHFAEDEEFVYLRVVPWDSGTPQPLTLEYLPVRLD